MEEFTAKEYIEAFISNQNNKDDWNADYPDGLSIEDLSDNDTVDIILVDIHGDYDTVLPEYVIEHGERINITDIEEFDTRYEI